MHNCEIHNQAGIGTERKYALDRDRIKEYFFVACKQTLQNCQYMSDSGLTHKHII
jgi:hypothetical protein